VKRPDFKIADFFRGSLVCYMKTDVAKLVDTIFYTRSAMYACAGKAALDL
jgi:hypothetical protein